MYELNGGFERDALERLVEYSYTSRLDVIGDQVKPVYMAAIRLKMERVANECARYMLSHLDLSSCLELRSMPGIAPYPSDSKMNNLNGLPSSNHDMAPQTFSDNIDFIGKLDEYIELNFEQLAESRELRALPRICLEILHLSKEEKEMAVARPLCELVLNWTREQWLEDETFTVESLTKRVRG